MTLWRDQQGMKHDNLLTTTWSNTLVTIWAKISNKETSMQQSIIEEQKYVLIWINYSLFILVLPL